MATYTITINEKTAQGKAIAQLLSTSDVVEIVKDRSLKGVSKKNESPYDPKFVEMIKKATSGKRKTLTKQQLWDITK